jgi:DNA-binding Lrp family transcriptional regulator
VNAFSRASPDLNLQGQRELRLLCELERDASVTQRSLARKLGVALGLTNLYLKRLARKGYIKITTIPPHRIRYLLTPRGMAEKSRLTYLYMQYSLTYYRDMRQRLSRTLSALSRVGAKRIAIYGAGELAELAYLTVREMDLTLVGFVDGKPDRTFLSYALCPVEVLSDWNYDAVLVADLIEAKRIQSRLIRAGVPKEKIVTLGPTGIEHG